MKSFSYALSLYSVLVSSVFAFAQSTTTIPDALMYQGKPIDPLCLFNLEGIKTKVPLSRCGLKSMRQYQAVKTTSTFGAQGFYGYDYSLKADTPPNSAGYSYYKPLGTIGHSVMVLTVNNGGGSGSFSSLNLAQRVGNDLIITTLKGGDRCNGAIINARRVTKGSQEYLVYSAHITAYDFLTLTNDNPHRLKPYSDLSACAACCAATALFQRPINNQFMHESLLQVDLNTKLNKATNSSPSARYQACFNKLLQQHAKKNHGKLNKEQLSRFMLRFNAKCAHGESHTFAHV